MKHIILQLERTFFTVCVLIISSFLAFPALADHIPDGILSKPAYYFSGYHTSITLGESNASIDGHKFESAVGGLFVPMSPRFGLGGVLSAENRQQILYEVTGLARLRFRTSGELDSAKLNADGPVGSPFITLNAGLRFIEGDASSREFIWGIAAGLPIHPYLTLGAAIRKADDSLNPIVDCWSAGATIYTQTYPVRDAYANPIAPEGSLAFRLSGGGSSDGSFVAIEPFFALNRTTVFSAFLRREKLNSPAQKATILGASFTVFPGANSRVTAAP